MGVGNHFQGSVHAVKTIVAHEGVGALYRGFVLAQLVWGPYNAVYLPLWEANKRLCVRLSGAESVEKLQVQYELGSAFVSSAFAAGLTNPMVNTITSLFQECETLEKMYFMVHGFC